MFIICKVTEIVPVVGVPHLGIDSAEYAEEQLDKDDYKDLLIGDGFYTGSFHP